MRPELGLVCITTSRDVRYRTITRTRLLALSEPDREAALASIYADNLATFDRAIDFCVDREIRLYRLTSDFMPFADTGLGERVLLTLGRDMARVGRRATAEGVRIVLHPDQFVVLSSDRPEVVENSVAILASHARIFDLLKLPRSSWALFNVHGGKSGRPDRLVEQIRGLPDPIRKRLTLENDEYAYGAADILDVCRRAGIPMVFDAHHHVCKEGLESYDDPSVAAMLAAARDTWAPHQDWQLVHISNGRERFGDRRHSDLIGTMPSSFRDAPWIEVEAKLKEEAIGLLQRTWLPECAV